MSTTFFNLFFVFLFQKCRFFNSSASLSRKLISVKHFFVFIFSSLFKKRNGERGIWTLAPVARPTPLAGAPLRPLEYFSAVIKKIFNCILTHFFVRRVSHCIKENLKCQANLSKFFLFFISFKPPFFNIFYDMIL